MGRENPKISTFKNLLLMLFVVEFLRIVTKNFRLIKKSRKQMFPGNKSAYVPDENNYLFENVLIA